MPEKPKHPEQVAREDWTGRRVLIKGTQNKGVVVGHAKGKSRGGGIEHTIPGSWFLKLDGQKGEDFIYEESELEVIK